MNYLPPVNDNFIIPQDLEQQCKIKESIESSYQVYFYRIMITGVLDEKQNKTYSVICSSFVL